jgi:hypothetical protein
VNPGGSTPDFRPLISAVVPTRNRSVLLREALESAFAVEGRGDLFDLEVIVVDDASTDATAEVAARYPVRYIRHASNRGLSASRNTGIAASRGRYIAFLDDDDLWLPCRFTGQVEVMESRPDAGLAYSSAVWTIDGAPVPVPRRRHPSGNVFNTLLAGGNFMVGSVLVVLLRRTALDRVGHFRGAGFEDYDLWLRLARHFSFVHVPGCVAVYRQTSAGLYARLLEDPETRRLRRDIVGRALATAPRASRRFRETVVDQMELRNMQTVVAAGTLTDGERVAVLLDLIAEYPRLVRYPQCRRALAWFVRQVALRSPSPLATATELCDRVQRACRCPGHTRRALARVWGDVAIGLYLAGRRDDAWPAVLRACHYDPIQLVARLRDICVERSRSLRPA